MSVAKTRGRASRAWLYGIIALMLVFVWTSEWRILLTAGVLTLFRTVQLMTLDHQDTFHEIECERNQAQARVMELENELIQLKKEKEEPPWLEK